MAARIERLHPPVTAAELRNAEARLDVELPDDYRAFLLRDNGGEPKPGWIHYSDDPGDYAHITQFWSAEMMETQTKAQGVPIDFVMIGTVSDEDPVMISLRPTDRGAVLWCADPDCLAVEELVCMAPSFDALLRRLDYIEATKPWMQLINDNDLDGLRRWLDAGGDPEAEEDVVLGISALGHATDLERTAMVELLLARGAKPPRPWWRFW